MERKLADGTTLVTFPNGFRLIISPRTETDSSALVLSVGVGSKHETPETSGLSHLLEHMVFQGTEHHRTQEILDKALANIGADFNAETDIESTSFTFLVPNKGLSEALELLCEVVCRPLLDEQNLLRERDVVVQELENDKDDPPEIAELAFANLLFPNHGLGRPIIGTVAGLRGFKASDLRHWYESAYVASNMVLSIVSSVPVAEIITVVEQIFSDIRVGQLMSPVPAPSLASKRAVTQEKTFSGTQAYLIVGAIGPSWHSLDRPAAELVTCALGGSLYARLPLLLRGKLGEVYSVDSSLSTYVETGVYSATTDCTPALAQKVHQQMIEVHADLLSKPFTKEEIDLARSVITGSTTIALDDSAVRADYLARQLLLHGVFYEPKDIYAQWARVTAEQTNQVAKKYLTADSLMSVVLSPEGTK